MGDQPVEEQTYEFRVAVSPTGVPDLASHGHQVLIKARAGEGSIDHQS
jgi:alanine dehydrogenase